MRDHKYFTVFTSCDAKHTYFSALLIDYSTTSLLNKPINTVETNDDNDK